MKSRITFVLIALFVAAASLFAAADAARKVTIKEAWVADPIGNRPMTAGYLTLNNGGKETALVGAECDVVKRLELHTMDSSGGMMSMKMVDKIDLPAGGEVKLSPGGLHLMFIGLKRDLEPGEKLDVTFRFADGSKKVVKMPVRSREDK